MKPIEQHTLAELEKALRDVEKSLADRAPLQWQQRQLILTAIEEKKRGPGQKYAGWKRSRAILDILQPGLVMSKQDVLTIMEENGVGRHPKYGSSLNNDAINYLLEAGKLVTEDGGPLTRHPQSMETRIRRA